MSNQNEKALGAAGYQRSAYEPNKWINTINGHSVTQYDGGSTTFSTSRHNTYGAGMSQTDFAARLKK
ncbi:hypothetical protein [Hufsiella ginkgonis]|uniref:Uncharacterized protein n=1 Tax=Hufsiella ginkgonis TaxID=2695274 RepID=A0A7K1Y0V3_9SPHI|nr:hypothetical protein [Hufsiella ginkgonis]MXV16904.1 hypothetical protein [Hufsiella ginkgonis]